MKPKFLKVALQHRQSFSVRDDSVPYFFNELHFHPEIELVQIKKGTGTQFVGNKIQHFKAGDMIMVGAGLPHLWRCDEVYFENNPTLKAEATVLHFLPECLGETFFSLPENESIGKLLQSAKRGLSITGTTKLQVELLLQALLDSCATVRIIRFLEILQLLVKSKDIVYINELNELQVQTAKTTERMNTIIQYMLTHFQSEIHLKDVAAIANISPNAFCRYFKTQTNKTYSTFLLEIKINHACKLLADTNSSISEICYDSGFNNFSNFNRYFKKLMGLTPLAYRQNFL